MKKIKAIKHVLKHLIILSLLCTVLYTSCDNSKQENGKSKKENGKYSFSFASKNVSQAFKEPFRFTKTVVEKNKNKDDTRKITYTSNKTDIATVMNKGVVTLLKKVGEVTISATKASTTKYAESTASYTLTITKFTPQTKQALIDEIREAIKAKGNAVNLNYIDTSDITDMSALFRDDFDKTEEIEGYGFHKFNGNISEWNTLNVQNMERMFQGNKVFNQDISKWNVGAVTNMNTMFSGAIAFNQNISTWTVDAVTNMNHMFSSATAFNQDISNWTVNAVTDMSHMFARATAFNQDISNWNVGAVTDMRFMFDGARAFNKNLEDWEDHLRGRIVSKIGVFRNSPTIRGRRYPSWCTGRCVTTSITK